MKESQVTQPPPTVSKAEFAYSEIRANIVEGRYSPGFRLVIDQLAMDLDVSAFPIREAVRRLESERLVKYEKNVGAQVIGISPELFRDAMEVTAVLEAYITSISAAHLDSTDLSRARDLNEEMRSLCSDIFDPLRFTALNQEFHTVLTAPCPNNEALLLLRREQDRLATIRQSSFSFIPGRARQSVAEHDEMLALLESDVVDHTLIEECARKHKMNTLQAFLERSGSR